MCIRDRVMPDTVKVIAVFVIAGVGAFDIVNLLLKLVRCV